MICGADIKVYRVIMIKARIWIRRAEWFWKSLGL